MQIKVQIKHTTGYLKLKKLFIEDLELWLITQYYNEANKIRMKVQRGEQLTKIDHIGRYTMIYKGIVADKAVSEVINLINMIEIE